MMHKEMYVIQWNKLYTKKSLASLFYYRAVHGFFQFKYFIYIATF